MKKHIPNFITSLNLFTGCVGIYFAFSGNYTWAFVCVLLAAIFDFMDGFAARLLKAYSPMGKELDSLADVISFGLLPGAIVFFFLSQVEIHPLIPFFAFLIPVFSGLRLAKFNVDERQTDSFIGLPVPANAIFWGGLIYSYHHFLAQYPWVVIALVLLFSFLLISELPMFSLKMKNLSWADNIVQYCFLLFSLLLIIFFRTNAFASIILVYILFSILIYFLKPKMKKD